MTLNYLIITLSLITFLATILFWGPNRWDRFYKNFTLFMSLIIFFYSLNIWFSCSWRSVSFPVYSRYLDVLNIDCFFTVDLTSLFFILITTFLFPFCILASWNMEQVRLLYANLILIELCLVLTFTVYDLFLFCVFFEAVLIPMFFIILWWGTRDRRIKAITYFFLYTLLGSVFLFLVMFAIYFEIGSTSFFSLYEWTAQNVYFVPGLFILNYISLLLFLVFAVKVPVFPFHIWLPEAHVEAPTVGSVILAGLLLKIGGYGILRFSYLFLTSLEYWQSLTLLIIVISIWLGSILATRQLDLKRVIAYSSIAHMNFALVGVFTNSKIGAVGAYSLFVSHGVVSSALFLLIGFLYDRHHTRLMHYYGGLVQVMPLWVFFFFIFILSNFSFPGTSNFIGEFIVFIAIGFEGLSKLLLIVVGSSTFLTVVYSILMFNRISFGTVKMQYISTFSDLTRREFFLILPLLVFNILFGLCPNLFIAPIYYGVLLNAQYQEWPIEWLFETAHPTRHALSTVDAFIIAAVELDLSAHWAYMAKFETAVWIKMLPTDTNLEILKQRRSIMNGLVSYFGDERNKLYSDLDMGKFQSCTLVETFYAPYYFDMPISLEQALVPINAAEESWKLLTEVSSIVFDPTEPPGWVYAFSEKCDPLVAALDSAPSLLFQSPIYIHFDKYDRIHWGLTRVYVESPTLGEVYLSGKFLN